MEQFNPVVQPDKFCVGRNSVPVQCTDLKCIYDGIKNIHYKDQHNRRQKDSRRLIYLPLPPDSKRASIFLHHIPPDGRRGIAEQYPFLVQIFFIICLRCILPSLPEAERLLLPESL